MLGEVLEESWAYQEIYNKGDEKGFHRGLNQGVELGKVEQARATMLRCVRLRFPGLFSFAEEVAERINGKEALEALLDRLFNVETTEQARVALSDAAISAEETPTDETAE